MKKRIISTILVIVIIINQITTSYANPAVFGALKEFGAWAAPQIASMSLTVLYDKLIKGFGENPDEKALIQVDGEQLQEEILRQLSLSNLKVKDNNLIYAKMMIDGKIDPSTVDLYTTVYEYYTLEQKYLHKYNQSPTFYTQVEDPTSHYVQRSGIYAGGIAFVSKESNKYYYFVFDFETRKNVEHTAMLQVDKYSTNNFNNVYLQNGVLMNVRGSYGLIDTSFYFKIPMPFSTFDDVLEYYDSYLKKIRERQEFLQELRNQNLVIKASLDDLKKGLVEFATQEDLANKELKKINLSNNKLMENINNDTSKIQKTLENYFKNEKKIAKDSQNATKKQLEGLKKAITDKQDKEIKLDKQIKEQTEKIANLLEKQNKEKEKYNKQALENDRELKRQFDELLERQKEELENEQAIRKQLEKDKQDLSSQSFDKIKEMLGEQIDNQNDLIGKLNKLLSIEEKENIIIGDILNEEKKGNEKNNVSLNGIENKLDEIIGLLKLIVEKPKDLVVPKNEWYDEKYNKLKDKLNKQLRIDYLITEIKKIEDLDDGDLNGAFKDLETTIMGKKVKIVDFSYIRKNREKIQYITGGFFYLLLLLYNYREIRKMLSKN